MHFHDGRPELTMHNRYLVLYHRATRQEIRRYERSTPSATLVLHPRRLHRPPRLRRLRERQLPRRRDHRLDPLLGPRLLHPGHAQPAIGGPTASAPTSAATSTHHAADHQGAVHPLGGVGGAQPGLPAARRRADRDPRTLDLRRADGAGLRAPLAAASAGRTADPAAVAQGGADRESPPRARCGSPTRRSDAPARRIRNGCSAPTCWSRPSSPSKARPRGASTSPGLLEGRR